jgi:hypothetical protein
MARRVAPLAIPLIAASLAGCSGAPVPSFELVPVPTQSAAPFPNLGPAECPGAVIQGALVSHDETGVAVDMGPNAPLVIIVWPHGWVARDVDGVRQLLDGAGRIAAREGDRVEAGGGFYPPRDWFHVCGEITVTP